MVSGRRLKILKTATSILSDDDVAPAKTMIEPLWAQLENHETAAIQNYDTLPTEHAYDNVRLTTSRMIAQWIDKVLEHK